MAAPLLVLGLVAAFHGVIRSGFTLVPVDNLDTRLCHWLLEHSWQWVKGNPAHASYWDAPFYFPAKNALGYTEILLGVAPPYWVARGVGLAPDGAFLAWMFAVAALNFGAMYLLLRRPFGLSAIAAGFGAYLFAFANMRITQLGHYQLWPQFYVCGFAYAVHRLLAPAGRLPPRGWIAVAFACVVGQLYGCFYWGWFVVFATTVAVAGGLAVPATRARLLAFLRAQWAALAVGTAASLAALTPLVLHYGRVASNGMRSFAEARRFMPPLSGWLYLGWQNWIYGHEGWVGLFRASIFEHGETVETRVGLGLVTMAAATLGLYAGRRSRAVRVATWLAVGTAVLITVFPGEIHPWNIVYHVFPAASALRAIGRFAFFTLMGTSLGLGLFIDWARTRGRLAAGIAVALLACLEQGTTTLLNDAPAVRAQIAETRRQLGPGCRAFLLTSATGATAAPIDLVYHLDAMWLSIDTGIPTLNGYSGGAPTAWHLHSVTLTDAAAEERVRRSIADWCQATGLDPASVCWLRRTGTLGNTGEKLAQSSAANIPNGMDPPDSLTRKNGRGW